MAKFQGGVCVKTYGCQMNEYDSDRMVHLLSHNFGLELVELPEQTSIVILNTCSVRERAQEKVFDELGRWVKWKNQRISKGDNPIIAVGGCVAAQEGTEIRKRAPFVDVIFGPQTLHRLPNLINEVLSKRGDKNLKKQKQRSVIDISFPEIEKFDHLPTPIASGVSSYVTVMEGCSKYCSFCIVPYTRGEEINRFFEDVIDEVQNLANQGVREINLLGQNVNAYRGRFKNEILNKAANLNTQFAALGEDSFADLAMLIETIDKIKGIDRIRYTTSHPNEMNSSLIDVYGTVESLVSHLHLPIQSGSDRILALMKRNHMVLEYKSIIRKIRAIRPDLSLSGDFIVGFPNETEEDHRQTMKLVEDLKYDRSFSFIYSKRPGTPAANLDDNVALDVKKRRLQELQELLNAQTRAFSDAMLETKQLVLVEKISKKNELEFAGRTDNSRIVNFSSSEDVIGKFVKLKITDIYKNSLRGELIDIIS